MSDLNLYRRLLDDSSDPIFSFDPDCRYLYANQALADGIGRKVKEVIGKTIWEVFPENEAAKRFTLIKWVFDHGESKTYELLISRADGDHYYLTTLKPIFDNQGRVSAILANSKDISERKKVEEELRRNQTMLARTETFAHIGSWEWDVATDAVIWSDELFRIFQRNPADGAPSFAEHAKLYYPEDMPGLKDAVEAAINHGTPYEMELRAIRQDGETRVCLARGHAEMDPDQRSTRLFGSLQDITERKQADAALRANEERLQLALSGGELGLWDWHIRSGEVLYSEHWFSMLGLPIGDGKLYLDSWTNLIHPDDLASVNAALESHLKGQVPTYECEHRVRHQDGRWLWLLDRGRVVEWDKSGAPVRAVGTYFDITQRKQAELELATSKSRYEGILQNTIEAYWRVDEKGRIVEANKAICQMLGYSKDELLRLSVTDLEVIESAEETRKHVEKVMREGHDIFESQHRCRNGRIIDVEISASVASDAPGNIDVFHNDVTERKRMEHEIRELAFHDPLTKLPNRRLLNDRLAQATTVNKRSGFYGALIFLDLDNFKPLNDEHGHGAGDLLLKAVALRLNSCVRAVDTVSRIGGDEFVVLLNALSNDQDQSSEHASKLAEKIRVTLARPYVLASGNDSEPIEHHCSASIGVVLFDKQHQSLEGLLKWADATMYRSKEDGGNSVTLMIERRKQQRP